MKLAWIGLLIVGLALLIIGVKGVEVYDSFTNLNSPEIKEGFIGASTDDIVLKGCPAGQPNYINNDGQVLCCDGQVINGKCEGRVTCSLSEGGKNIPTCGQYYAAFLNERGRDRCPASMPNYYEDGLMKGCTAGKRTPDGKRPSSGGARFCRLYTSQAGVEQKEDSCENQKMLDAAVCPGTPEQAKKSLVNFGGHQIINCSVNTKPFPFTCFEDDSYVRFLKKQNSGITNIQTFIRGLSIKDKLNFCSIVKRVIIDKSVSEGDISKITINDGYVSPPPPAPKPATVPQPGPWKCLTGISVPVRKNGKGDVECMATDGKNCMWQNNESACRSLSQNPPSNINPLACGEMHKKLYGSTGYDSTNHWCSKAKNQL